MRWICSGDMHSTSLSAAGFSMLLRPALPKGRPRDPSQGVSRLARSPDAGSPAAPLGDGNERNDKYGTANSRAAAQRTAQIARAAIRSNTDRPASEGIRAFVQDGAPRSADPTRSLPGLRRPSVGELWGPNRRLGFGVR